MMTGSGNFKWIVGQWHCRRERRKEGNKYQARIRRNIKANNLQEKGPICQRRERKRWRRHPRESFECHLKDKFHLINELFGNLESESKEGQGPKNKKMRAEKKGYNG